VNDSPIGSLQSTVPGPSPGYWGQLLVHNVNMSDGKSWLRTVVEHVTGNEYATAEDVREFVCDPLGVWIDDGLSAEPVPLIPTFYGRSTAEDYFRPGDQDEAIFWGRVTIEFTPEGDGVGWARVIGHDEPPPDLHVDWHLTSEPVGFLRTNQRRYGVSRGLILKGEGSDGQRYIWRINGAS
jgi:hypothetical protein